MSFPLSRRRWLQVAGAAAGCAALPVARRASAQDRRAASSLLVRSESPLNAEPPLGELVAAEVTPVERFYVRNHGPIPKVDWGPFRVRIEGLVRKPLDLTLAQLRDQFANEEVAATLTCAGNRRLEMNAIRAVPGVQWDAGAIGHGKWMGPALWRVLAAAEPAAEARHVWFEGLDSIRERDGSVAPFGGSVPIARALAHDQPAMLAHALNGQPLSPEHGFPLRTVVPGYIGARSVKWLVKIVVSDVASPNHYMAEAYKVVSTDSPSELARTEPIYEFPLNAAICSPAAGANLKAGRVAVRGYCLPPGDGRSMIAKVEVSADGGRTWRAARVDGDSSPNCWSRWTAAFELTAGDHELVVRATDSQGQVQPERALWNLKGYLHNAWHRCPVRVA